MSRAITIDRIEDALDILAARIAAHGDKGRKLLPLYQSIERDLDAMKSEDDALSSVLARAKRSSNRMAIRSC